jgi:hypothetical protein
MLKNKEIIAFLIFAGVGVAAFAQNETVYDDSGKRDPFIPLVTADGHLVQLEDQTAKNTALAVEGIMYDLQGVSYALVNGEVVRIGDTIAGYQVLRIEKNKVIFIKEGTTTEVESKKEGE